MTVPQLENELENLRPVVIVEDSNYAEKPNLKGDWLNFFLLLLMYTMQGVAFGLALVMPIILQGKKNVSYKDQVNILLNIKNGVKYLIQHQQWRDRAISIV